MGDEGISVSSPTTLSGGLKICDGSMEDASMLSRAIVRRAAVVLLFGVASPTVFRRGEALEDFGAGVKSSSSSSCCVGMTTFSTSDPSSSSTTTFLRDAARRDGLTDESAMLVLCASSKVRRGGELSWLS